MDRMLCEYCGNERGPRTKRFCSKPCIMRWASKAFPQKKGKAHPQWSGGRYVDTDTGYVRVNNGKGRYVLEHRVIMEKSLGRKLRPSEIVHHINGDKGDNRPENLELLDRATHAKHHDCDRERDELGRYS